MAKNKAINLCVNPADLASFNTADLRQPNLLIKKQPSTHFGISRPVMSLYQDLKKKNLGLSDIAAQLHRHKMSQVQDGLFSQNFYTQTGSGTEGWVIDSNTGKQKKAILWCINHYTGLNRDKRVIQASQEAAAEFGTGSGTSAMSCGHSLLHKKIEAKLTTLLGKEEVILFPTGYSANLGMISAMATAKDLILFDREAHASIIDGIKLSGATFLSFKHNDIPDLERKLKTYSHRYPNVFVIVESAYSMSGDIAPLAEIAALKQKYAFYFYVDEAHTFGLYGQSGAGLSVQLGVADKVDFLMSTLSKSTASIGGFVACDRKYKALFEWTANAYIFQAAFSPADAGAILAALDILHLDPSLAQKIHSNNRYMRQKLRQEGFNLGHSQSPVIPIFIKEDAKLLKAAMELLEKGVFTVSVIYPAVKAGEGRLRLIITASHTQDQIDHTIWALTQLR